jgi:hypothetical protein
MRYTIPNNTPDEWQIVPDPNGEFKTLKEAKKELISICKLHIKLEKEMINQVKNYEPI